MTALEKMRADKEQPQKKLNIIKVKNTFIDGFIADNNTDTLKILFYIARSGISKTNEELRTVTIDTKKMCEYCNIDIRTLKGNLKKMQKTIITLVDDEDEFISVALLPKIHMTVGRSILEVALFGVVLDLVLEVERKYTVIDLNNLMKLKNKHSLRMIQILEHINGFDIDVPKRKRYTLEELQVLFGVNYKTYYAFEKAVLIPCKEELDNKSNLSFIYDTKFKEAARGRPSAVGFIIDLIDNKRRQPPLF